MFIDTHCHLQDEKYNKDEIDKIVKRSLENNVNYIIVSGYDNASNLVAIELAEKYDSIYATIGFHPLEANKITDSDIKEMESYIGHPKVVAIGEIGLDYHYETETKEIQKELFIKMIELANKYKKTIVVHSRDSIEDTYEILKAHKDENIKGVLHCYASSYEMSLKFNKLGIIFGIGGVVTYKNSHILKEVVEKVDIQEIILETDAPYLTPEPYRGENNEPSYIPIIAKKIAEIKGLTVDEIAELTTKTARSLFDF